MEQNEIIQNEEITPEDSLVEELVEDTQDESISLEEALGESAPQETPEQGTSPEEKQEPGYVQRRISKAVEKALAEQREAFEQQMAPMREYMLNQEAQELVRTGKVKDLETAKELVRYRQGQPQPVQQTGQENEQPRDSQGRFASQDGSRDPAVQARIDMLQHQADRIKASGGPDVIAEFRNSEEIRMKIVSGEMDFYDVAEQMRGGNKKKSAPMRSPNGASTAAHTFDFANMSSEQFAKLEKRIQEGARISLK